MKTLTTVWHIYIFAPLPKRIERIKDRYHIETDAAARKEIARTDKIRRSYYQYYTDRKWGGVDGKTMAIDSSFYGIDGTVDLIVNMVHKKWPDFVSLKKQKNKSLPDNGRGMQTSKD